MYLIPTDQHFLLECSYVRKDQSTFAAVLIVYMHTGKKHTPSIDRHRSIGVKSNILIGFNQNLKQKSSCKNNTFVA